MSKPSATESKTTPPAVETAPIGRLALKARIAALEAEVAYLKKQLADAKAK